MARRRDGSPTGSASMKIVRRFGVSAAISAVVFFAVAVGLVQFSPVATPQGDAENLRFENLRTDASKLPPLQQYEARDGHELSYRHYDSGADRALILLHGSAYHSGYLQPLASYLSERDVADVYTPDLRGHGPDPADRGDVAHIGQLEDDISELVALVRQQAGGPVVLGGHSSGGGTVIRYAGGTDNAPVDGFLALSPYVHHTAPTYSDESSWANVDTPRMVGLSMLNFFRITAFNHEDVISFNMPREARDGTETLRYSYTLQTSMHPRGDYGQDIAGLEAEPSALLVGANDEVFNADAFPPVFADHSPSTAVEILEDTSHFGLVTQEDSQQAIADWVRTVE